MSHQVKITMLPDDSIYMLALRTIVRHGIDEKCANKIVHDILAVLADKSNCFPAKIKKEIRDARIKRAFRGGNYRQLATKFNVSVRTIYRVVSSQ
ncbi:MAG: hypothetical protein GY862_14245 [Gammaproteobacteria bacterium]|nr:hypothetical protein [Gammaproteobacteria bacterium]